MRVGPFSAAALPEQQNPGQCIFIPSSRLLFFIVIEGLARRVLRPRYIGAVIHVSGCLNTALQGVDVVVECGREMCLDGVGHGSKQNLDAFDRMRNRLHVAQEPFDQLERLAQTARVFALGSLQLLIFKT